MTKMKITFDIAIGLENEEYISFRTQIVQTHLCFEFLNYPPVYLHLIFEISSVTRFFFKLEISSLKS